MDPHITLITLGVADQIATLNFENDDNVTHLLVAGFQGAVGDDVDLDDDCVVDPSPPWSFLFDRIALIKEPNPPTSTECHYGSDTVGPQVRSDMSAARPRAVAVESTSLVRSISTTP